MYHIMYVPFLLMFFRFATMRRFYSQTQINANDDLASRRVSSCRSVAAKEVHRAETNYMLPMLVVRPSIYTHTYISVRDWQISMFGGVSGFDAYPRVIDTLMTTPSILERRRIAHLFLLGANCVFKPIRRICTSIYMFVHTFLQQKSCVSRLYL